MSITDSLIPATVMQMLTEKIEAETGLSFAGPKRRDLIQAIHRMAGTMGMDQDAECIDWLLAGRWDKSKADLCASHLTIGETYFFREPRAFDLVRDYARNKIKAVGLENARLRIWSAGCCTGEEPYSIAMALRHGVPELASDQYSILGTDINSSHLQFARAGVYRHWSFRNTSALLQKSNFSDTAEGRFRLSSEIRKSVKFSELNLATPVYPSVTTDTHAMDIIFCRNVLMYFSRAQVLKVIERFRQCLVNGGWLIVSPSEASSELFAGFTGQYYPDAIYFKKNDPMNPQTAIRENAAGSRIVKSQSDLQPKEPIGNPAADQSAGGPGLSVIAGKSLAALPPRASALMKRTKTMATGQPANRAATNLPAAHRHYLAKALIAMEAGDQHDAVLNLRRALYLQPDSIVAHYLMGVVRLVLSKHREAIRQFEITRRLLAPLDDDAIVPDSEGWSAAYLRESIRSQLHKDDA